jgi:hypothetical protein
MKKPICFLFILFSSLYSSAQNFTAITYAGLCDLRYINPDNLLYPGSSYSLGYSVKAGIYYDFYRRNTKFYPGIGFSFTLKNARNSGSSSNPIHLEAIKRDSYETIDLPVYFNYRFRQRFVFKAGANSSMLIAHSNHGPTEPERFTFGLSGGASLWINRFSLNCECIYDLNDMLKGLITDVSYRNTLIHVGVGYSF